ncbi:MAG: hypothetical protein ISS35_04210 [Kiritimatiellae bacterium]|nr:hypothetical protein [Kiritimatiellia bacterium]
MLATESTIPVIDFETTGTVPGFPDEPWQIGIVLLRNGHVVENSSYTSLLRVCDRPFNPYAPGRHAQIRASLYTAPTLHDLWPELRRHLQGNALAAHNAGTEKKILSHAFPLHRAPMWVDTLKLVRVAYPHLQTHKLEDVTRDLGLTNRAVSLAPGLEPHDALFDAVACAVLLEHLLAQPAWRELELNALPGVR